MLDFNTFIFIGVASFFTVVGVIVWFADGGVPEKYKSILTFIVIALTAGLIGLFCLIDDDSEFEYSGYNKVKSGTGGGGGRSMSDGGGGGGQANQPEDDSGGAGDDANGDADEGEGEGKGKGDEGEEDQVTQDCDVCPKMVKIAPGMALLGSTHQIISGGLKSGPAAEKNFHKAYYIGKFEVTVGEFQAFLTEVADYAPSGKCLRTGSSRGSASFQSPGFSQTPLHPAVCVSWTDASYYTDWLSKKTGKKYRLPTEAEWEFAARAGTGRTYVTGDALSLKAANFRARIGAKSSGTSLVGSYESNNNGMYDVHGNAWEIVGDCWSRYYQVATTEASTMNPRDCTRRIVKGGSWSSPLKQTGFPMRGAVPENLAVNGIGFRVMHE